MRDTVDEMLKIEVMHFELYISYHNIGSMKLLGSNHMPVSTIQPGLHKKKKNLLGNSEYLSSGYCNFCIKFCVRRHLKFEQILVWVSCGI